MIFVTVGTQLPFDRLIKYIDDWHIKSGNNTSIIGQVGKSGYEPKNMVTHKNIEPSLFEKYSNECDVLVSHAGMGSILTALRMNKPIIIFPRSASLKEHRNDHQLSTTKSFSNVEGIYVAYTESELNELLNRSNELKSGVLHDSTAFEKLKNNLIKIIG